MLKTLHTRFEEQLESNDGTGFAVVVAAVVEKPVVVRFCWL